MVFGRSLNYRLLYLFSLNIGPHNRSGLKKIAAVWGKFVGKDGASGAAVDVLGGAGVVGD